MSVESADRLDTQPDLVVLRPEGLYCVPGDFYIDPMRAVPRAVITHAHADHARRGHGHYLAHRHSVGVLRARLGNINIDGVDYGETVAHNGVTISLHPAGHVLGSAQVRLAWRGQVWVVSGDYFVSGAVGDTNATCAAFEPVRCHCFITESTFALPIYRWPTQASVQADIQRWWQDCADESQTAVLMGYSLGKAQRLLAALNSGSAAPGPIYVHPTVHTICQAYAEAGVVFPDYRVLPAGPSPLGKQRHQGGADAAAISEANAQPRPMSLADEEGGLGAAQPRERAHAVGSSALDASGPAGNRGAALASELRRAVIIVPPGVKDGAWAQHLSDPQTAFASGWMQVRQARRQRQMQQGFVLSDHADWPGLTQAIAHTGAERVIVTHGFEDVLVRWLQEQGLQASRFAHGHGERAPAEEGPHA